MKKYQIVLKRVVQGQETWYNVLKCSLKTPASFPHIVFLVACSDSATLLVRLSAGRSVTHLFKCHFGHN